MQTEKQRRAPSKTQVLAQALREKCLECSGGVRSEVDRCRVVACPLHKHRKANDNG